MRYPRSIKCGSAVVKIYRTRHGSTASGFVFQVGYVVAGIRKLQQFASEVDAEEEARLRAAQLAAGRIESATIGKPDRDELLAARQIVGKKCQLLSALREWSKAHDLTRGQILSACEAWASRNSSKFESLVVREAVKRFTAAKAKAGVDVASSYNRNLPALVLQFGDRKLDTLTARELGHWLETRYPHPVTRNTARKRSVALWRWARRQGYLPRDAQTEIERTDTAKEAIGQIGVINAETLHGLLNLFRAKHPEYLAALVVAAFCGLRRSEVHQQTWEDISFDRKFVRVTSAKRNTPARRLVPLCDVATEWLFLCKNRKGPICTNLAIDRIRDIARVAKFTLPDNAFRHSFISHRVAKTGDIAATALESGNSVRVIFRHYRELFTKAEGEAWFEVAPSSHAKIEAIRP